MKIVVLFLFAVSAEAQIYEGDHCSKDGVAGVCTNLDSCPSALNDLQNKKKPQNCSFGGSDPIVCCVQSGPSVTPKPVLTTNKRSSSTSTTEYIPEVYNYKDANPPVGDRVQTRSIKDGCEPVPSSLTSKKTGQKAWDKCVEYQEKLVFPCVKCASIAGGVCRANGCHHNIDEHIHFLAIGGNAADDYEFSHMALLGYGNNPADLQWLCGGSLISDKFVLTAGHCISSRDSGEVTYAQLGILRRSTATARNLYRVKKIHRHSKYDPPNKYHDIALLELDRLVPLNEYLVPACIHTGSHVNDSVAIATGWGLAITTDQRSTLDHLQKVILTKFDDSECAFSYQPFRHMVNGVDKSSQVCYGDRTKSRDICKGDSGGPLQIESKQIACMYTIIGVTSFGSACEFLGVPGIYTRVQHYVSWIEGIVWP